MATDFAKPRREWGFDFPELPTGHPEPDPKKEHAAALFLCSGATGADDARMLLEACGLVKQ
jgi:hypothetical protein